ncbi:hypothetical protein SAMN03080606_00115 [Alkaliphilus peptidifermentans DSM 18978]|uniref:Transposase for insertion sequence element IS21-like C-terminal domain-containing protein n=1 Tax=Alkaliphilus peptidifermentans DSM 18978 TaxID=1120976 RepID=A0A1G5AG09_9FIRM|nr:hypothetical protein [Alkaliphilus peptidifermentans]SCX76821.1 hypothetical protein SAMN03080606_00115 [Alkaliphilus peptidifermentans DSM 18978]
MVTSNKFLLIEFDRNHYSVPYNYGFKPLRVEAFVDRIEIYGSSKLISVHDRCYSQGEKVMKLEHYLPILEIKPRAVKNALVVRKLPQVYQSLRELLCSRNTEGYREFAKILLLNQEYDFEEVLIAIEESFKISSPNLATIKYLLAAKHIKKSSVEPIELLSNPNLEVPVDSPTKFDCFLGGVTA